MAKITIFRLAGTGTSSIGRELARQLNYQFLSTGDMFRAKALSLGLSLYEFDKVCVADPSYDRALDEELELYGQENDNFVVESRLAWHFIPDSIKIKIACDFTVRVGRVAKRDGVTFEEARDLTLVREEDGRARYQVNYGIANFGDDNHFDLVVDSTETTVEQVVALICEFIDQRSEAIDQVCDNKQAVS
jgi:CMP/dCMP kinase